MRRLLLPVVPVLLGAVALAGCSGAGPVDAVDAVGAGPVAGDASPPDSAPDPVEATAPRITFPQDVTAPEQGGQYVVVVLATGTQDDIDASLASVSTYGYSAGISDAACLAGAAERLDLADDALVSSLLFADKRAARQFADAYIEAEDGPMVGRAAITAYCLD
jgi:hypothetical protein